MKEVKKEVNFIVTYKFMRGVASADFPTLEQALEFARHRYGSRIYVNNDGYYVPYKASEVKDG